MRLYPILFLALCIFNLKAQEINFLKYFQENISKSEGKTGLEGIKKVEENWHKYTKEQQDFAAELVPILLKNKIRSQPEILLFFDQLKAFSENEKYQKYYQEWVKTIQKISERKDIKNKFHTYLLFVDAFLQEEKIAEQGTRYWQILGQEIDWEVDQNLEPYLALNNVTVKTFFQNESISMENVSGNYYIFQKKLKGEKGKIIFPNFYHTDKVVFASVDQPFELDFQRTNYEINTVKYWDENIFSDFMEGKLIQKINPKTDSTQESYPRFYAAKSKEIKTTNLLYNELPNNNIGFSGIFIRMGREIFIKGTDREKAQLHIQDEKNHKWLSIASESFNLAAQKLFSNDAQIDLKIDHKNITAKAIDVRYLPAYKSIIFYNKNGQTVPFFDAYHLLKIYAEQLTWNTSEKKISWSNLRYTGNKKVLLESINYFDKAQFESREVLYASNPLKALARYAEKSKKTRITLQEIAKELKAGTEDMERILFDLNKNNFIDYNFQDKDFTITHYLKDQVAMAEGKKDFDKIRFFSDSVPENVIIDLENYDLTLLGTKKVAVSDEKNINMLPDSGKIVIKKDLDFDFNGVVNSGRMSFFGQNFYFDYQAFKIKMKQIDSLKLRAGTGRFDEQNIEIEQEVNQNIEKLEGEVLIDAPESKSGKGSMPIYPQFISLKESYVYYNRLPKLNEVYKKNTFHFRLHPFSLDSIDRIQPQSFMLFGDLVAEKIMPNLQEAISIQSDYSLGFKRQINENGMPIYERKAKIFHQLNLSNAGLQDSGLLVYQSINLYAPAILLTPDSAYGVAQEVKSVQQTIGKVSFPNANGKQMTYQYFPQKEKLILTALEKNNFHIYDATHQLIGEVNISPQGFEASGIHNYQNRSQIIAASIKYTDTKFIADSVIFRIKNKKNPKQLDVEAKNYTCSIDIQNQQGIFRPNFETDSSYLDIPKVQYRISQIDYFMWNLKNNLIYQKSDAVNKDAETLLPLIGVKYTSLHPEQEELSFYAPLSSFDAERDRLIIQRMNFIKIADAIIFPDTNQEIEIIPPGIMMPIKNAKIVMPVDKRTSLFYNANLKINSRKNYEGTGFFDFINQQQNKFTIAGRFKTDDQNQSSFEGMIKQEDNFLPHDRFHFKGIFHKIPSQNYTHLNGEVKMRYACKDFAASWFPINQSINQEAFTIELKENKTVEKSQKQSTMLLTGWAFNLKNNLRYGLLTNTIKKEETPIFNLEKGKIIFDESKKTIYVIDSQKTVQSLALDVENCQLEAKGLSNLAIKAPGITWENMGQIKVENQEHTWQVAAIIDFYFSEELLASLAEKINAKAGLKVNGQLKNFQELLKEKLSKKQYDEIQHDLISGKKINLPKVIEKTILLADLKMIWVPQQNIVKSRGKIGIAALGKHELLLYTDAKLMLAKNKDQDIFGFYLPIGNDYYYFYYNEGVMQIESSDEAWLRDLQQIKPKKRRRKIHGIKYEYQASEMGQSAVFLHRFESNEAIKPGDSSDNDTIEEATNKVEN